MRLPTACAALLLATTALCASTSASEIYQWKDARGVTHFSETPPPAGTPYQTRRITESGTSTPAAEPAPATTEAAAAAGAEPSVNPQGATARSNIEILQGEGPVQQDDGSGNARELSADERTNQLELAQAAVRAYCD